MYILYPTHPSNPTQTFQFDLSISTQKLSPICAPGGRPHWWPFELPSGPKSQPASSRAWWHGPHGCTTFARAPSNTRGQQKWATKGPSQNNKPFLRTYQFMANPHNHKNSLSQPQPHLDSIQGSQAGTLREPTGRLGPDHFQQPTHPLQQ